MNYEKLKETVTEQLNNYDEGNCDWKDLPEFITDIVRKECESNLVEARVMQKIADTIEMPSHINLFNACIDRCDVLQGHCACGAHHKLSEWKIEKI